jgi:hypothetical protein
MSADLGIAQPITANEATVGPAIHVNLDDPILQSKAESQLSVETAGLTPALFVENQGQWSDASIRYIHDGDRIHAALTDAGVLFRGTDGALPTVQFSALFVGANLVRPAGLKPSGDTFNYYLGDEANWRQNVPSYEVVAYQGLYDGVDLRVQGLGSHLKYEFHVAPGADYRRIAVRYAGIKGLSIADDGSLQVNLGAEWGVIRDDAPYIYQEIDGQRVQVAGRFVLLDNKTYTFEITGAVDPNHVLVIDPDLVWSTCLGAGNHGSGRDVAVDADGNVYVTGEAPSTGSMTGGFDATPNGGQDGFVVKFSPTGQFLWGTFFGGNYDDMGTDIAVDADGNVYVTGETYSSGWTSGGYDTTFDGHTDAFVIKLDSSGRHLWSTYVGGGASDSGKGIAIDSLGRIYVAGSTSRDDSWTIWSEDWTSGGFDTTYNGGGGDAFVARLGTAGNLIWSTYLGGTGLDRGYGIAVDAAGDICATGDTYSAGWTSGGYDTTLDSEGAGFVVKLNAGGQHVWSTYVGRSAVVHIATDASRNIFLGGTTTTSGWMTGGFDTTCNGESDAMVVKLSSDGRHLWSTCLGGPYWDVGRDVAVSAAGDVYVTGSASSEWWGTRAFDVTSNGNLDIFVAKLSSNGALLWNVFLGGIGYEEGEGIAVDADGNICVTGSADSYDWVVGAFSRPSDGYYNGFLVKLSDLPDTTPPTINDLSISNISLTPGGSFTISYTVSDTGGSGLDGVELWRTNDPDSWPAQPERQENTWDNGPHAGSFSECPPGIGTWWYQVRVVDGAGNAAPETVGGGQPFCVVVKPAWVTPPCALGSTSIRMVATAGSGVEYYFHETTGHPGGTDSGWQDSNLYVDTGLSPNTVYTYEARVRNKSTPQYEPGYSTAVSAATPAPVYRFYAPANGRHFFTISESEKNKLINNFSNVWTYEGIAFYAYPAGSQPAGMTPVYRFWSAKLKTHFFTTSENEKNKLINELSNVWTYERIAWYAFST